MLPRLLGCALMLIAGANAAAAGSATSAVTSYPPPPVPSCDAVFAQHAGHVIWVGKYSGRYKTQSKHGTAPYGATGCFLSQAACRQWLHQNMSFAGEPMYVMSCRPANGGIARY